MFVQQTAFQQRMLQKYGKDVALLDATYRTSNYDRPLFMVAVQTNSGYTVVGSFIVGRETSSNIEEALSVLRSWTPSWSPIFFICDYDQREISALEKVFQGNVWLNICCIIFLCKKARLYHSVCLSEIFRLGCYLSSFQSNNPVFIILSLLSLYFLPLQVSNAT